MNRWHPFYIPGWPELCFLLTGNYPYILSMEGFPGHFQITVIGDKFVFWRVSIENLLRGLPPIRLQSSE